MNPHIIIIGLLLSGVVWQIINAFIIPITIGQFILIEVLLAISELFTIFVMNQAKTHPTDTNGVNDSSQHQNDIEK